MLHVCGRYFIFMLVIPVFSGYSVRCPHNRLAAASARTDGNDGPHIANLSLSDVQFNL